MKLKKQIKYLLLNCFTLLLSVQFIAVAKPNNETKITRTTSKSFRVNPDVDVSLTNKYGKVIVNTWEKPTVKVEVNVTAFGKNEEVVQKLLKRVDLDFDDSDRYVDIQTVLDRKSGFLQDVWNTISDQAKVVFNKNRIQIDYELYVPQMAEVSINNKFGDVFLGELEGQCNVRVSHGNLRVESLKEMSKLHVNFGKATLKSVEQAVLNLQGGTADVNYANMLELNSHASDVSIDAVNELRLDTRSGSLRIRQAKLVSGKSTFTKINIDKFTQDLSLKLHFGDLIIREITDQFSQIAIESKSTDIDFYFHPTAYFDWSITSKEDKTHLPSSATIQSNTYNEDEKLQTQKGAIGKQKAAIAHVSIYADGGDVNIRLL
ncbi:MAG: DUF4097 family beta strand repeat-containing protein [Flammeovirgaceae bacterium]